MFLSGTPVEYMPVWLQNGQGWNKGASFQEILKKFPENFPEIIDFRKCYHVQKE